jgi:hypothetical protein
MKILRGRERIPPSELVMDYTVYPRHAVDTTNIADLRQAIRARVNLPKIIAEAKTNRIVDGFHRKMAYEAEGFTQVEVEWREYESDAELFLDAARLNSGHGRKLDRIDQIKIITRAISELNVDPKRVAAALNLSVERVNELSPRVAYNPNGDLRAMKAGTRHLWGKQLTEEQADALPSTLGRGPLHMVNSVLIAVEGDLFDLADPNVRERLERLAAAIEMKLSRSEVRSR